MMKQLNRGQIQRWRGFSCQNKSFSVKLTQQSPKFTGKTLFSIIKPAISSLRIDQNTPFLFSSSKPSPRFFSNIVNYETPATTLKKLTDQFSKHKTIVPLNQGVDTPLVGHLGWVAPSATLVGQVQIYAFTSVWYSCVIRGDTNAIRIGAFSNIQDNTVILANATPLSEVHDGSTIIGHYVTIGHNCILQACTVEEESYVGMNSILEPDSYMEKHSMLGASSRLTSGSRVKSGELWVGNPAKFSRKLTAAEIEGIKTSAEHYVELAKEHRQHFAVDDLTPVKQALQEGLITHH